MLSRVERHDHPQSSPPPERSQASYIIQSTRGGGLGTWPSQEKQKKRNYWLGQVQANETSSSDLQLENLC